MANVAAGDLVQIRVGAMDVTNGVIAKSGNKYVEGSSLWATVEKVVSNWNTGGVYGLPKTVTKVRCKYGSTIVWQVQPDDIVPQVIKASEPETIQTTAPEPEPTTTATDTGKSDLNAITYQSADYKASMTLYAPLQGAEEWGDDRDSTTVTPVSRSSAVDTSGIITKDMSGATIAAFGKPPTMTYPSGSLRSMTESERRNIGSPNMTVDSSALQGVRFSTVVEDPDKLSVLLGNNTSELQNVHGFPAIITRGNPNTYDVAKYDYQITPGDTRYNRMASLEDRLMKARAAFGIPVHGSNSLARAMKYYLYNRFKSPDINLAHNKTFTHVFFTRPDLNIMCGSGDGFVSTANQQVRNHTEAAMIWRRYPDVFKLLTKGTVCKDSNNFNFLLSNQVTSFDIQDETISNIENGKSWNEYSILYGDAYTGRTAGEFTCNFTETSDYSVINMLKLWITYIDNVARGAWRPSYDLTHRTDAVDLSSIGSSYVYQKTLDYAASCYVFKTGPDGEDILYWSKYYGVFPTNTGANALSWDIDTPVGTTPKLSIKFNYSFKKDLSPISLIEFNRNAYIDDAQLFEPGFDISVAHSARPFVGCPYIAMQVNEPSIVAGGANYNDGNTQLRLKFRPSSDEDNRLSDNLLYRAYISRQ